jgi:hypothetical protein
MLKVVRILGAALVAPVLFSMVGAQVRSNAAPPPTIWNAGGLTFTKPASGSQDCITAQTCLTRSTVLYNSVTGGVGGQQQCPGYQGPLNTEWALGHITDWNTLTYRKLYDLNNCLPPGMVQQGPMVLHLISENIYLQVRFNAWGAGNSTFSYTRTTGPAASTASVSGRVVDQNGRAVRRAVVTLTDQNNISRTVMTHSRGYYQFDNVVVGPTYAVSAESGRFTSTPHNITVNGNLTGQNVICQRR